MKIQYVLDEVEHKKYLETENKLRQLESTKQALIEVRDYLLDKANYKCVYVVGGGYCIGCPCSPVNHNNYDAWRLICGHKPVYGK